MQNFNEFLIENYGMTEEAFFDMETPVGDSTKRVIWAEWNAYVMQFIG